MKLGISTYTYTWAVGVPGKLPAQPLNVFDLLAKADAAGVKCVQIADNLPLHVFSEPELDKLIQTAQQKNISLEVGTRGLTPENIENYLNIAKKLQSPFLRMVVDAPGYYPDPADIVTIIREAMPEFEKRNIVLALENHDRFTARTFESILNRIGGDHIGICLDSVNSMGAGEGIETVVEILSPYTINLHVKDFTVKRVYHMMGFVVEGCPAGQGMLPLEYVLEKLEPFNRCRSAILELWTPPEEQIVDTIGKEVRWADESILYLRKHFKD